MIFYIFQSFQEEEHYFSYNHWNGEATYMNDYTEIHQNSYTFTQKLVPSSSLMSFRDISSYSIHKSHGILTEYSMFCFHMNLLCTDAIPNLHLNHVAEECMHHFCHGVDPDSAFVRSILGMGEGSQVITMESSFDI